MKVTGTLIFFILLGLCTFGIWPLYKSSIEKDLTDKVRALYVNKIHGTPEIHFEGLHLQIDSEELTPYFYQKLDRVVGAYIPEASPHRKTQPTASTHQEILPDSEIPEISPQEEKPVEALSFNLTRLPSTIRIGGLLPDEATREAIITAIKESSPTATIINQTKIATEATPTWWDGHPAQFLPGFLPVIHGHAYLSYGPEKFEALAKVGDPNELSRLQSEITRLPSSLSQKVKLAFLAPPKKKPQAPTEPSGNQEPARALIVELDESQPTAFDEISVTFGGGGSAWLHPKYDKKLQQLTALINGYPDSDQKFTITSYGTKHLKLSELRAQAVKEKLISFGIASERLLTAHLPRKEGEKRRVQLVISSQEEIDAISNKLAEEEKATQEAAAKAEAERLAELALPPVPDALEGFTFTFGGGGSAWLHPKTFPRIEQLATFIKEHPDSNQKFTVASYGTKNPELSRLRAKAIYDKLISFEVSPERLLVGDFSQRKKQKRRVQLNLATEEDLKNFTSAKPKPASEEQVTDSEKGQEELATNEQATGSSTTEEAPPETIPVPEPPPVPPAEQLKKLPINFSGEFSTWIHSSYYPQLRKMAGIVKSLPEPNQIIVVGSYGSDDQAISEKRAAATVEKLISNGIPASRLRIEHFPIKAGESSRIELTLGEIPAPPKAEIIPEETPEIIPTEDTSTPNNKTELTEEP